MAIPSRQINWGTNENLLWQISKELDRLVCSNKICPTTTTTTTQAPLPNLSLYVAYNPSADNFNIPVYDETSAGDFTIEWFSYMLVDDNHPRAWSIGNFYDGAASAVSIENGIIYYWVNGSIIMSSEISGYIGKWTHFCVERIGDTVYMFVQGSQVATATLLQDIPTNGLPLYIASEGVESLQNGAISNFRWVLGSGIYTPGEYVVPTAPLDPITGTKLLIFQGDSLSSEIIDNSGLGTNVILNGAGVYDVNNPFYPSFLGSVSFQLNPTTLTFNWGETGFITYPAVSLLCDDVQVDYNYSNQYGPFTNIDQVVESLNTGNTARFGVYSNIGSGNIQLNIPEFITTNLCSTGVLSFTVQPD